MDRKSRILKWLDPNGVGLEIGPSHNPIASKREGFKVHILDHLSQADLVRKYQGHGVVVDNIEEVDFVWSGERFSDLIGSSHCYDWIIASHVIEHTPDLVGFINQCDELLKDGGRLVLAIPDKRYCFDHFRPDTGIGPVIDAHLEGHRIHTAGSVVEYFLNVTSKDGAIAWEAGKPGSFRLIHTLDDALRGMSSVRQHSAYLDIHRWCFVPHSFRLLVSDLQALGLIRLKELYFSPTVGHEFYACLALNGAGPERSRVELVQQVELERHNSRP